MQTQLSEIQAEITVAVPTQLANTQVPSRASPLYVDIACTAPNSQARNLLTLSSITTPSTMTDTLYCTIDTSRIGEEDKNKAQQGVIRQAIEEEIQPAEGHAKWRCVAVIKDARNIERIKVTYSDEAELQLVKEAAQKTAATGA
jgi:hypothetical protein